MTRTSIQALITLSSLCIISAMPFLDTDDGLQKYDDNRYFSNIEDTDTDSNIDSLVVDQQWPSLGDDNDEHYDLVDKLDNLVEELHNQEQIRTTKRKNANTFFGTRGKRLGFGYFPFRFSRQFFEVPRNRRISPRMFVAARGKRENTQMDNDLYDDGTNYFGNFEKPIEKRRRLGFSALRGR